MNASYGKYLNPDRSLRTQKGVKGIKKTFSQTVNPSRISEGHRFTLSLPSLGENDVIVPGSVKLCGDVDITSTDVNRRLVGNYGRNRFSSVMVSISGEEVLNLQDADVLFSWMDMWKGIGEREKMAEQGVVIEDERGLNLNGLKIRCGSGDKDDAKSGDKALAEVYGSKFCTPLDFEILQTSSPFYPHGLKDRLQFEFIVNKNENVIVSSDKESKLEEKNLFLEYTTTRDPGLANEMKRRYAGGFDVLYDRIIRLEQQNMKDNQSLWNFEVNVSCKSLKGLLFLWKNDVKNNRETEKFVNPNIKKIELQVKGEPNVLYPQGMKPKHFYDEAYKHFVGRSGELMEKTDKHFGLTNMSIQKYYGDGFGLWIDFRSVDDNGIHGSGMRFNKVGDSINIKMDKQSGENGNLKCFVYAFMDAVIHIQDQKYSSVEY